MGDIDIAAKAFFRDPRNFADLFNFKLFDGRPVISPDQLTEVDVTETLTLGKNSWQDTTGSANGAARISP